MIHSCTSYKFNVLKNGKCKWSLLYAHLRGMGNFCLWHLQGLQAFWGATEDFLC